MVRMGTALNSIFQNYCNWKVQLMTSWDTIMGSLASQIFIEKIEQDLLILGVSDSSWMQELYLLSPIIINKINQSLGAIYIKQIKLKFALPKPKPQKRLLPNPAKKPKYHKLTNREKNVLKNIKDKELSWALQQFLIRCYQVQS